MRRFTLPLLAGVSLALPLALAGCSTAAEPDEEYTATPAADVPGAEALQADGSTVGAGQWGVVRYVSTNDEETILAIRTVGVVTGEPGDLREVMVAGQLDLEEATPYYIAYTWTDLSGDDSYSPVQSLAATGGGEPSTLLVPDDLEKCEPRAATDVTATFGAEQRGCAVAVSIGGRPTGLMFQGPQGSSADVTFELPAS